MNWDMVTALSVVLGTIAVVVSLFHVVNHIKEATQQRRLESYHAILGELDGFGKLLAQDHANSDIWWRASKGLENLTDADRVRYFGMLSVLFRAWENAYHYHREGEWQDWRAEVITKMFADITMSRGVQEYWALRKRWYTAEFQEWADNKIRERSGVDIYGEQFRIFGSAEARTDSDEEESG